MSRAASIVTSPDCFRTDPILMRLSNSLMQAVLVCSRHQVGAAQEIRTDPETVHAFAALKRRPSASSSASCPRARSNAAEAMRSIGRRLFARAISR